MLPGTVETTHLWNSAVSEDPLEDSDRPADDDIVTDILHDRGRLTGDECQKDWRLVEIPEEEELTAAGRRAADMAEQVCIRVPEYAVKAQDDLQMANGINSRLIVNGLLGWLAKYSYNNKNVDDLRRNFTHLVEISESEAVDGGRLPVGQRRREKYAIDAIASECFFEDTKGESYEKSISLVRRRVGVGTRMSRHHFDTCAPVTFQH